MTDPSDKDLDKMLDTLDEIRASGIKRVKHGNKEIEYDTATGLQNRIQAIESKHTRRRGNVVYIKSQKGF